MSETLHNSNKNQAPVDTVDFETVHTVDIVYTSKCESLKLLSKRGRKQDPGTTFDVSSSTM